MSGKQSKKLRREAEAETIGMSAYETRKVYKAKKKAYRK